MPKFNTADKQGLQEAKKCLDFFSNKGLIVDISYVRKKRSNQQNRALHLFFTQIAENLTELGIEYQYRDLIKDSTVWIPYTGEIVKEFIWKPIQKTMFNIDSTTNLDTRMINEILDVIILWFSESGIPISFPNKIDLLIEQMNKNESLQR